MEVAKITKFNNSQNYVFFMKKVTKILMGIAAMAVIAFVACNKEANKDGATETAGVVSNPNASIGSRSGESTTEQEGAAYKADILMWKTKFDVWRAGTSSTEVMEAEAAVEKLEAVFNYYLCDAAKSYNVDKTIQSVIEVSGTNTTWSSAKVASTFEAIKAKVIESYETLNGSDKGIRFIDLGTPTVSNGNLRFHIFINMGSGVTTQDANVTIPIADDVKWGDLDPKEDKLPSTANCLGGANVDIATRVNAALGFYVGNVPINFPGITNPNQNLGVVLENIGSVVTNLGAVPPPPSVFQPLFVKNTLDLLDPSAAAGPNNDYPDKGQYKIHCDSPDFPSNQFCFSPLKITNYVSSNEQVGRSTPYLGRVRTLPKRNLNKLVGTFIITLRRSLGILNTQITREHVTVHYYARAFLVPTVKVGPKVL